MTKKTRNWLIALSILAFPFVLFFGCLMFMNEPAGSNPGGPQTTTPQEPVAGTNVSYPPR
jgi:hypothetical protein